MADEEALERRLQDCLDLLGQWEERILATDALMVAPGSSLAKDDRGLNGPHMRTSAWIGLVTAVDHLSLAADTLSGPGLRGSSFFTVTRAALVGASQTVWVLSGSRAERRAKALSVAEDELKQHHSFLKDFSGDERIRQALEPVALTTLVKIESALGPAIGALPTDLRARYQRPFETTRMVREAAAHLASKEDDPARLEAALGWEWRVSSAAAHGRQRTTGLRESEIVPMDEDSNARVVRVSFREVAQSFIMATLMTHEAWHLWDLRRGMRMPDPDPTSRPAVT